MNAVGINVSKGRSMVAILRPMGEVVQTPIGVIHNAVSLEHLAHQILALGKDTRVVMEATGRYHEPVTENCMTMGYSFPSSIPSPSTGIAQAVLSARSRISGRML